jgi:hypothetical protein
LEWLLSRAALSRKRHEKVVQLDRLNQPRNIFFGNRRTSVRLERVIWDAFAAVAARQAALLDILRSRVITSLMFGFGGAVARPVLTPSMPLQVLRMW